MKRWQLTLMRVVLLTLAFALLIGLGALLLVPILWFLGCKVRAAGERPLKATVRFVIASFAALGYLVVIGATQAVRFLPRELLVPILWRSPLINYAGSNPLVLFLQGLAHRTGFWLLAMVPFALSCLLVYWLEDTYARLRLEGVGRTTLRAAMSLLLASFAAIGFWIAFLEIFISIWHHPVEGSIPFDWTAWGLLGLSFVLPFYATWKLLRRMGRSAT